MYPFEIITIRIFVMLCVKRDIMRVALEAMINSTLFSTDCTGEQEFRSLELECRRMLACITSNSYILTSFLGNHFLFFLIVVDHQFAAILQSADDVHDLLLSLLHRRQLDRAKVFHFLAQRIRGASGKIAKNLEA